MKVNFYPSVDDSLFLFSVIVARYQGKWIFCKQKVKDTWEIPGGTRENNETILQCAKRELREESGAINFEMEEVCAYSVIGKTKKNPSGNECFGMLYFAEVHLIETHLDSEMEKIKLVDLQEEKWTYPLIQPRLFERVKLYLFLKQFYELISFEKDEFFNKSFISLFAKEALIINQANKQVQTIQEYIKEFDDIIQEYPNLFLDGFHEKQISFEVLEKNNGNLLVCSTYEKRYTKNNKKSIEYGENYITIQKDKDSYIILNISYQDNTN